MQVLTRLFGADRQPACLELRGSRQRLPTDFFTGGDLRRLAEYRQNLIVRESILRNGCNLRPWREPELGVPVKLVGLGEGPDDLAPFDPDVFVTALIEE